MKALRQSPLVLALASVLCLPLAGCDSAASLAGSGVATAQAAPNTKSDSPASKAQANLSRPLLLTGVVEAIDSQPIIVPPTDSWPNVLRNFAEEGSTVKNGDVVLRIDTQERESIQQLRIGAVQAQARADKEIADLEVKAVDAERALFTARAAFDKAKVDAALPKGQISLLDFDRYQGERERAERDLDVKQKAHVNAAEAVVRRRKDAELEYKKQDIRIAFITAQQEQAKVHAKRDGVITHGYNEWEGGRFEEGSEAAPGMTVAQIVGNGAMQVKSWALEADRPYIKVGQPMQLSFDALPGARLTGVIKSISSAPEPRTSWGNARYFRIEIELPANHAVPLSSGMSALIEPVLASAKPAVASKLPAPASQVGDIKIEGEIASKVAAYVSPPMIPEVWQYSLGQIVPEGTFVKTGQMVATFQATEVVTQLASRTSTLKEKQSTLAKTKLDHAEAERSAELAVAEAQSNFERAQRKASQSRDLIRRVDYDKLVIDRILAGELARLSVLQRDAQQRARVAEMRSLNSEIAQTEATIKQLTDGQANLLYKAPRDGMVIYRSQRNGDKVSAGSQVWMGQRIATIADADQLVVQAKVPEVQAHGVQVGQAARVTVSGANLELNAKVSSIGMTFHGKSKSQPVVVRDIELSFDTVPKGIKPGSAVQVTLLPVKAKL